MGNFKIKIYILSPTNFIQNLISYWRHGLNHFKRPFHANRQKKYKRTYKMSLHFLKRKMVLLYNVSILVFGRQDIYVSTKLSLYFFIHNLALHNITTLVHTQYINLWERFYIYNYIYENVFISVAVQQNYTNRHDMLWEFISTSLDSPCEINFNTLYENMPIFL